MKASYVCLILLVAGLPCLAAETISNTHTFGCEGVLWDYESASWRDNTSVSWTHTLAGFTPETSSVTAATLKIDGCGIENVWWDFDGDGGYEQTDYVAVKFMGQDLGQLTGNSTTFNLSSDMIQAVTQANAEISFRNDLLTVQGRRGDYFVDLDWVDSDCRCWSFASA